MRARGARWRSSRWAAGAGAFLWLLAAGRARAGDHDEHVGGAAPAETTPLDPGTAEIARCLWGDLVCLCGRCERLTLSACHCADAAAERTKIVAMLRGRDLASPAARATAYQTVLQDYSRRFPGKPVLASEQRPDSPQDWPAPVVAVGIVALACGAVAVIELRRRRHARPRARFRR